MKLDSGLEFLNDLFTHKVFTYAQNKTETKKITTRPYRAPEVAMMLGKYD